ncbi:hypothetical protein N9355_07145 [Crocinitomicaceae bacterium]|nr:hypothetical protein [Crocinitomicaceae bacterium]
MKKITLLLLGLVLGTSSFAQTSLFSDDFESGDVAWTLSVTGTNGWVVNDIYAGFQPLISDTPDQPSQISTNPQSNYLHVMNSDVCSQLSVCNANYDAGTASTSYAEMANALNTTNYLNTTISFWWLCVGAAGNSYGELEYSTDNQLL